MPPLSRQLVANLSLVVFTRVPVCASGAGCAEVWLTNIPSACSTSPHTPVWKTNVITSRVFFLPFPPILLLLKWKHKTFPGKPKMPRESCCQDHVCVSYLFFKTKLEHCCCCFEDQTKRLFMLGDYDQQLWPTTVRLQQASGIIVLLLDLALAQVLPRTKRIIWSSNKPANLITVCCCSLFYPHEQHMALFWLPLLTNNHCW